MRRGRTCLAEPRDRLWHGVVALHPLELPVEEVPMQRVVMVTQGFARQSWGRSGRIKAVELFKAQGGEQGIEGGKRTRGQDSGMGGMSNSSVFQVCVFTCLLSFGSLRGGNGTRDSLQ